MVACLPLPPGRLNKALSGGDTLFYPENDATLKVNRCNSLRAIAQSP